MYTKKDDHQEGRTNSMKKEKLGETIIESQEKLESTDATAKVTSVDKAKVNLAKVGNSFKESGLMMKINS